MRFNHFMNLVVLKIIHIHHGMRLFFWDPFHLKTARPTIITG